VTVVDEDTSTFERINWNVDAPDEYLIKVNEQLIL
jgi:hypothetical protein